MDRQVQLKESSFHDDWAASVDIEKIPVRAAFESPTALENRHILRLMGDIRGKKILDVGCGLGESAVYFALKGARVTATDLSPGMIQTVGRLATFHKVEVEALVSPGEELSVGDNQFDFVYSANTLHHVTSKQKFMEEIRRVLKPGGRCFLWDPIAYNPVINVYRRMAVKVRTEDESPLKLEDIAMVKSYFKKVNVRTFWISALTLFLKYYLIDKVDPNAQRYWKKIYEPQSLGWWRPFTAMDRVLTRLPLVRWLAWNVVIAGEKAG
jgi:ubiquinone/menaquinone biosynthesis C-methylase UbiE